MSSHISVDIIHPEPPPPPPDSFVLTISKDLADLIAAVFNETRTVRAFNQAARSQDIKIDGSTIRRMLTSKGANGYRFWATYKDNLLT